MASSSEPAVTTASERHPKGFFFFFWGEFAERSSYYGMRAILFQYMATSSATLGGLGMGDTRAAPIYSYFKMACYFLPLLGGYVADRFFGKYWTIVGFSIPYVLGHFILGIHNETALFFALALLACGSGVIKPNISTLMGLTYDQQRPGQERLRGAAFLWFYFSVNVGAALSTYIMPDLRTNQGYAIAFQFPAWLMVVSLGIFAWGKPYYAVEKIEVHTKTPEERREQWQTLRRLFAVFGLIVLFWIPYEYNDNIWIAFTRDYVDLNVSWRDKPIPPDQIQTLNPVFVLILIPIFNGIYKLLDPDARIFTATRKILAGFAFTTLASAIMAAAANQAAQTGAKVSIGWPSIAYIVLTIGEVLLYGTALELSYAAAPKSLKGFVTACFLVTNAIANFINSFLTQLYGGSLTDKPEDRGPLSPFQFFTMATLIVLVATIAFVFVGRRFDRGAAQNINTTPEPEPGA